MLLHGLPLNELVFDFDMVLSDTACSETFCAYLASEYNCEPLLFILAANKLKQVPHVNEQLKQALVIVNNFVQPIFESTQQQQAKQELNLSAEAKQKIISCFAPLVIQKKQMEQGKEDLAFSLAMQGAQQSMDHVDWPHAEFTPWQVIEGIYASILLELKTDTFPRYTHNWHVICF